VGFFASALRAPASKPTKSDPIPNLFFFRGRWVTSFDTADFPLFSRGGLFSALFEEAMEICFSLCYNECVYTKSIAKGEMSA